MERRPGLQQVSWAQDAKPTLYLASQRFGSVHDARREEDHELAPRVAGAAVLEQEPEQWDVAEEGHLVEVATGVPGVNAADHCRVAVEHEELGFGLALQDGRIAAGRRLVEVGL